MFGWSKSKNNNIDPIVEENTEKVSPERDKERTIKNMDFLTIDQVKQLIPSLDDNEILLYIKEQLNIAREDAIEVTGELTAKLLATNSYHYRIYNVKLKTSEWLEYPINDLNEKMNIKEDGIYAPPNFNAALKQYVNNGGTALVKCELELSSVFEREKHENPLLLNVDSGSMRMLQEISKTEVIKDGDGNILIENSIVNYYAELNKKKIDAEIQKLKEKKLDLDNDVADQEKLNDKLIDTFKKFKVNIKLKENEISSLLIEREESEKDFQKEKKLMNKKLEKLISFIEDKADTLKKLDFIDEDEYNDLIKNKDHEKLDGEFLDFENDLEGNKQKAIKNIQAYLFQKDIFYPYYILEDFFALVQTNDLIILAGESGSGKTNLVKSFAEAIGGVAEIIPVKPNWTSSEDLLGYYNPLEKKYLTTPFLEALLKAKNNPNIPYFICLDEMNLARVEYYFADFLSLLEERKRLPEIKLYSADESSHINSELSMVLSLIESTKIDLKKDHIDNYVDILKDKEINQELKRVFGFSDKDSLIKYHSDLKKMLSGILSTPSSIEFPKNVRIIGTVNIDETTYYLSPKILDRAHIMKFDSPLLQDWAKIEKEVGSIEDKKLRIKFKIEDLGERIPYPPYKRKSKFCKDITDMTKKYFSPLGVEVGLRTISQGLNYEKIFIEQGSNEKLVINNFMLHKILPKINFDGNKKVGEQTKNDLLLKFKENLKDFIDQDLAKEQSVDAIQELEAMIKTSENNDGIVNYWG